MLKSSLFLLIYEEIIYNNTIIIVITIVIFHLCTFYLVPTLTFTSDQLVMKFDLVMLSIFKYKLKQIWCFDFKIIIVLEIPMKIHITLFITI